MKSGSAQNGSGETLRRKSLGRAGESVAREYLANLGFRIIAGNFRRRGGEIDIIAIFDTVLAFIEVKTRIGSGNPIEGYSEIQMRRMVGTSEAFIAENENLLPDDYDVRYDLVIVGSADDGKLKVIQYLKDSFKPE
ncbi:MAG: YraN family protein [bacterium]|nr:YraN family protein [bacterium]